jgi:hypothetical protein
MAASILRSRRVQCNRAPIPAHLRAQATDHVSGDWNIIPPAE